MQTVAEVLKKIEDYSISNRAEFEALVKKNLAMQQTDQTKKQQKRIPQITTRLEQIDKVLNKLYEDNALGAIPQDRYEQMSQKYSEEYYTLKTELATLQEQLSAYENAGGRAQKFLKLTERHAAFTDLTPAILNEFISRIEVHERDQKRARYAMYNGRFYPCETVVADSPEYQQAIKACADLMDVLAERLSKEDYRLVEELRTQEAIAQCEENESHFKYGFSAGLLVQQEAHEQMKLRDGNK